MRRALRRFVSKLTGPRRIIFFLVLFLICVVAICIGIYIQFFYKYADTDPLMIGINIGAKKTEEEITSLKANFNSLFNDSLTINSDVELNVSMIEPKNTNYVYTAYNVVDEDENYYSINAKIPVINIDSELIKKINSEIKSQFYEETNNVRNNRNGHSIYTVTYAAFINEDTLSLVIKSSLKEEGKSEKVVVKTYNYKISTDSILTLNDLIELKGTTKEEVQNTIDKEVKNAYNNAKIIAAEYGNLYERDLNSDIYKVDSTENFFLTQDGYVYVVYAYGNNDYTNEMDLIIF